MLTYSATGTKSHKIYGRYNFHYYFKYSETYLFLMLNYLHPGNTIQQFVHVSKSAYSPLTRQPKMHHHILPCLVVMCKMLSQKYPPFKSQQKMHIIQTTGNVTSPKTRFLRSFVAQITFVKRKLMTCFFCYQRVSYHLSPYRKYKQTYL